MSDERIRREFEELQRQARSYRSRLLRLVARLIVTLRNQAPGRSLADGEPTAVIVH